MILHGRKNTAIECLYYNYHTFKKEVASSISTMLLGQEEVFTELGMSIIGEIGNIVGYGNIGGINL